MNNTRVKICAEGTFFELEDSINNFLENHKSIKVIDIKFEVVSKGFSDYKAMIIYEEGEKE